MTASQELHEIFRLRRPVARFLVNVLRPIICMMMRLGVSSYAVTEIVRWLYVDVAMNERDFAPPGSAPQTKSRAALLTGLSRREVLRLDKMTNPDSDKTLANYSRIARVASGWMLDPSYRDTSGRPAALPVKSSHGASFFGLVADYAGDIPYRTVLDEMIMNGMVKVDNDGNYRLVKKALVADNRHDKTLTEATDFAANMLQTLDRNLCETSGAQLSHRFAWQNTVSVDKLEIFAGRIQNETEKFEKRLSKSLDGSVSTNRNTGEKKDVGIAVCYFER